MIQYIHFLLELEWISNNCGSKLLKGLMYSTSYQIKYNEGMSSLEFHLHTQLKKTVRSKRRWPGEPQMMEAIPFEESFLGFSKSCHAQK